MALPVTMEAISPPARKSIFVPVRRVASLSLIAGYVDALGFIDLGGTYPGAMTGNTVQFGLTLVHGQWSRFDVVATTLFAFFCGGLLASLVRQKLRHPALELLLMAALLLLAQWVRFSVSHPIAIELPLLAVTMAMQGETIARFGGMSIQTIVVTNNMLKCADGVVGYLRKWWGANPGTGSNELTDFVLPGCAWVSYVVGAAAAALAVAAISAPFVLPAVLLVLTTLDLLTASQPREG